MNRKRPRRASHGMVATSQPLAVRAGLAALQAGGSAVDAAIAANVTLALVEPMSCGLGGDAFALVWSENKRRLFGLNGSGRAPAGLTIDAVRQRGLDSVPTLGPLSWTVPGCVEGWAALHERFGRLPWGALFASAVRHAEDGFAVTPVIARMWREAETLLAADPGSTATFLRDGRAPRAGDRFRNLDLGRSLRRIADDGPDAFYRGPIAERLVDCAERVGAALSADDLARHASTWVEPLSLRFGDVEVWELPPNTQGAVVLEMLNILSGFDLAALGRRSAEYLHALIETKKLAFENRARFFGDPEFGDVAIEALLSPEHGRRQRERIDPGRAAVDVPASTEILRQSDTVYITAVDEERNACSLIQSLFHPFGSGITPPELGFAMQNRGSLFHLDPRHPNALAPHKRPFHTIIPAMVTRGGFPVFSFGVMGGDMQPQGQVQVLLHRLVFGLDPQAAGDAPRVRHDGSSSPTGEAMRDGGVVHLEPSWPHAVAGALQAKGHRVVIDTDGYGGYQGIWIDRDAGTLAGGSESRKDGCALGY